MQISRSIVRCLCAAPSIAMIGGTALVLSGCEDPPKRTPIRIEEKVPPKPPVPASGDGERKKAAGQERAADILFPHKSGSEWMFVEESPAGMAEVTMTVKPGADRAPDTFTVETRRNREVVMVETYRADDKGLTRISAGYPEVGIIEPPMPMIVSPAPDDRRWSWKGEIRYPDQSIPGEAQFTVSGPEPVQTKAGTFQAFRIEQRVTMKLASGSQVVTNKQWFAPKVGLVKILTVAGGQKTMADLGQYRLAD